MENGKWKMKNTWLKHFPLSISLKICCFAVMVLPSIDAFRVATEASDWLEVPPPSCRQFISEYRQLVFGKYG